jgi:hypothetical protein
MDTFENESTVWIVELASLVPLAILMCGLAVLANVERLKEVKPGIELEE